MTRDRLRDLEALGGGAVISWFCPDCRKATPILDEKAFEHDRESHRKRHRVPPPRGGIERSDDADEQ